MWIKAFFISLIIPFIFILSGAAALSPEATEIVGKAAVEYLKTHPEAYREIIEHVQAYAQKNQEEQAKRQIQKNEKQLFKNTNLPILGNPTGETVMAVFMDPFCGFCRRFKKTLDEAMRANPDLKVIFYEIGIVHPESAEAIKILLAAQKQGKYREMQDIIYTLEKPFSEDSLIKVAAKMGLNIPQFTEDRKSPEIQKLLEKNNALANAIEVSGTPTLIIQKTSRLKAGAIDLKTLESLLQEARKNKD